MKGLLRRIGVLVLMLIAVLSLMPWIGPLFGFATLQQNPPVRGERLTLRDERFFNVFREGSGEPLIMVHGLPGGAFQFDALAKALLERGHASFRYDRMGWGYSAARQGVTHDYLQNARELIELMEAVGDGPFDLAGFSYGGGVVQALACLAPEKIRSATLISSIGPAMPKRERGFIGRLIFSEPVMILATSTDWSARSLMNGSFEALFYPDPIHPELRDRQITQMSTGASLETWLQEGEDSADPTVLDPACLQVPTLLLQGSEDQIVSPMVADDLVTRNPRITRVDVAGKGHAMVMLDADLLAARISAFLGSISKAGVGSPLTSMTVSPDPSGQPAPRTETRSPPI